nr:PREDICTED: FAD synthase-like isoform X2 [Megachile rotundata]
MDRSRWLITIIKRCFWTQHCFYNNTMTSLLVPHESVRGMTCLNREAFKTTVELSCLKYSKINISKIKPILKKYVFKTRNFKSIQKEKDEVTVYLNPFIIKCFKDFMENEREYLEGYVYFGTTKVVLNYDNWTAYDMLKAILPEGIDIPTSYSLIGHILHLNLRDAHLPYKSIIGQIYLDTIPNAKTVVNKINNIDTAFRHFSMEILAGDKNTVTTVKEHGCTYELDFSQVYWNSRLSTEHSNLITFMKENDVLYDVFAGVGPFAVPAARKKIEVLANDLNPEAYKWLQKNITINKVQEKIRSFKTAALIVIGDEILRGQVVDTNTSYLAKSLRTVGIKLQKVTVIPDIVDEIAKTVYNDSKEYPIVFTSGGVGPTHDDVTYEAVAKAFELKLESHEELIDICANIYPNEKEAERLTIVPRPCELIYAYSPKKYAVVKAKNVYILPGSPKYFEGAIDVIISQLKGNIPLHIEEIDINLNELSIVKILDKHAEHWKGKVNIGSYPQTAPECFTRISLEGKKEDVLKAKVELLYNLPIQKIRQLDDKFSYYHAKMVFEDAENQPHIKNALNILQKCYKMYKPEEIFISFNGGKDCTVVLHLTACVAKLQNISSLLCLYVTAEPFPEVDSFVEKAARYYDLELIKKRFPIQQALHSLLSERKNLKASLMGMRSGDPGSENVEAFTPTDPSWPKLIRVNPILNWSYDQVWKFLLKHNVPYCPLYDQGYTSLGRKSTTVPNPRLRDPNNPSSYLPAYTLADESAERQGRV